MSRGRSGGVPIPTELETEQAYVDHAYEHLTGARDRALALTSMVEVGSGGTNQARFERDAIWETVAARLGQLDMGDAALVFGRIDQEPDAGSGRYYIGRVGVWDSKQDPVVVDWRAPVAESFYRATGSDPMGLQRRRHFVSRGRTLLGLEDELFGDIDRFREEAGQGLHGEGALIAALETARTGRLQDIVATIQAEQDKIIRAPLPGVLLVSGGPGTGKTVVALHRAAYLLYTHRFPLEGQGVLVVGPNRLFLAYIEQVLPSLGEAGVEMATLGDLVGGLRVLDTRDAEPVARLKGDLRMVHFVARAVRTRQRPLRVGSEDWLRGQVADGERRRDGSDCGRSPASVPHPQRGAPVRRSRVLRCAGLEYPRGLGHRDSARPSAREFGCPRGPGVDVARAIPSATAQRPVWVPGAYQRR